MARVVRHIVEDGLSSGEFVRKDPELFGVQRVITVHILALKGWALHSRSDAQICGRLVVRALRSLRP